VAGRSSELFTLSSDCNWTDWYSGRKEFRAVHTFFWLTEQAGRSSKLFRLSSDCNWTDWYSGRKEFRAVQTFFWLSCVIAVKTATVVSGFGMLPNFPNKLEF
jgi:hypothetical protein